MLTNRPAGARPRPLHGTARATAACRERGTGRPSPAARPDPRPTADSAPRRRPHLRRGRGRRGRAEDSRRSAQEPSDRHLLHDRALGQALPAVGQGNRRPLPDRQPYLRPQRPRAPPALEGGARDRPGAGRDRARHRPAPDAAVSLPLWVQQPEHPRYRQPPRLHRRRMDCRYPRLGGHIARANGPERRLARARQSAPGRDHPHARRRQPE
jgi:hypothetical protein